MALVDYGSSGDDSEEETEETVAKVEMVEKPSVSKTTPANPTKVELEDSAPLADNSNDEEESKGEAFKVLPRPSPIISQDIAWNFLDNKNKGKVKIYAPALPKDDEEEEIVTKKVLKPSKKGCGLFSLLPSPKHQFLVAPSAALKKPTQTPQVKKPLVPKQIKRPPPGKVPPKGEISDDSEGEAEGSTDFFSLDRPESPVNLASEDFQLPLIEEPKSSVVGPARPEIFPPKKFIQPALDEDEDDTDNTSSTIELDSEALSRLCGGKASRRSTKDNIEIIDVNYSSLVPDANEWLAKELSQEQSARSSSKRKHEPTSQQRRKHQITFLAYQAKEQELELKNQWANNRMTRKQTQAKYGF